MTNPDRVEMFVRNLAFRMTEAMCENGGPIHCLHYQEGDGDCCACGKGLAHCDDCGWAGEPYNGPEACAEGTIDPSLCPECGTDICYGMSKDECKELGG